MYTFASMTHCDVTTVGNKQRAACQSSSLAAEGLGISHDISLVFAVDHPCWTHCVLLTTCFRFEGQNSDNSYSNTSFNAYAARVPVELHA